MPAFSMLRRATLGALGGLLALQALAQSYPNRPVKIIVPFAAGGGPDIETRRLGPSWPRRWAARWWSRTGWALLAFWPPSW